MAKCGDAWNYCEATIVKCRVYITTLSSHTSHILHFLKTLGTDFFFQTDYNGPRPRQCPWEGPRVPSPGCPNNRGSLGSQSSTPSRNRPKWNVRFFCLFFVCFCLFCAFLASGKIVFATVFVSNRDADNRKRLAAIINVALGGHPGHPVELPPGQGTLHCQLEIWLKMKMRMLRMRVVEMNNIGEAKQPGRYSTGKE